MQCREYRITSSPADLRTLGAGRFLATKTTIRRGETTGRMRPWLRGPALLPTPIFIAARLTMSAFEQPPSPLRRPT